MASRLDVLIDKEDSFEIVRNSIAQILADESAAQVARATSAGKADPSLWDLKVYRERSIPWDLLNDSKDVDHAVNVWFDSSNVDEQAADPTNRQTYTGNFNIDIVFGSVALNTATGYAPADEAAALGANRILRLCRNILMSDDYTYLRLRQIENPMVSVAKRWVRSMSTFQPQLDNQAGRHIVGMRLELAVRYSEFSPQYEPATLNYISTVIQEDENGRVLVGADFDFTT